MKKCMLIGGGDIGKGNTEYETKEIDQEIVKMTEKTIPNFLFIGLASSYSDSYYDIMKKIYKELGCTTVYLKKKNMKNNPDIVKTKIESADIIYIGGGDTVKLLEDVKEYKIDSLLVEAYERGCVLAGISAGAILLSKEGFSDSQILRKESEHHTFINGLGLVDISICPHFHENTQKTEELKESLEKRPKEVYGIENCVALKIEDNKMSVVRSNPKKKAYNCTYKEGYREQEISI